MASVGDFAPEPRLPRQSPGPDPRHGRLQAGPVDLPYGPVVPGNKGKVLVTYEEMRLPTVALSPEFRSVRARFRDLYKKTAPNLLRRDDYQRWSYTLEQIDPAGSLLDVGIGVGQFVIAAHESGKFSEVVGVDIRPHSKLVKAPEIDYHWANAAELPFARNSFEVVTCMECLEHMDTDTMLRAIGELRRVCAGRLIMTVPFEEPEPLPKHHVQRFDADRISELFPSAEVTLMYKKDGIWPWAMIEEQPARSRIRQVLSRAKSTGYRLRDAFGQALQRNR